MKISALPVLASTLLCTWLACNTSFASGSYSTPSGNPASDAAYQLGKSIFNGQVQVEGRPGCSSCHTGANALTRNGLRKRVDSLIDDILTLPAHEGEVPSVDSTVELKAIEEFLKRRFRLN